MTNSSAGSKVVVNIFGEEYPITGYSDPAYITRIADFVDLKMKEASRTSKVQARDKVAILAALSIASELDEKREALQQSGDKTRARIESMIARLDSVLTSR